MKQKIKMKWKKFRRWLLVKLVPDGDARMTLLMHRVGYEPPWYQKQVNVHTLSTQVVLNQQSYEFLRSGEGTEKYDAVYGLTRQLADSLRDYVQYTESYDEAHDEWTCRVDLKVVKE